MKKINKHAPWLSPYHLRFYLSCILALNGLCIYAQSISPLVLSNAGNTLVTPQMRLSWTLGEVAVARWEAPSQAGVLTEGFHQSSLALHHNTLSELELVQIVPNPVKNLLNLNVIAHGEPYYLAKLQDAQGKMLIKNLQLKGKIEIDVSAYAAGMYFLSIHSPAGVLLQHHKLVKL